MTKWIKKIHMYLGLLNFTILVVFGIVGLSASFLPPPNDREPQESTVQYVGYEAPTGLGDRDLADHAYEALKLPMTQPAPDWSLGRNDDNNLRFLLPTIAKRHNIVLEESQARLKVTTTPFDTWQYLFHLHEITLNHAAPDWRVQAWAAYVELSIWSLILMALGGIYLWLVSRPGLRWAQLSMAGGVVCFVALWVLSK